MLPRRLFDDLPCAVASVGLYLFLTSLVPQLFVRALLRLSVGYGVGCLGVPWCACGLLPYVLSPPSPFTL